MKTVILDESGEFELAHRGQPKWRHSQALEAASRRGQKEGC
jgi:hypothetical protein